MGLMKKMADANPEAKSTWYEDQPETDGCGDVRPKAGDVIFYPKTGETFLVSKNGTKELMARPFRHNPSLWRRFLRWLRFPSKWQEDEMKPLAGEDWILIGNAWETP